MDTEQIKKYIPYAAWAGALTGSFSLGYVLGKRNGSITVVPPEGEKDVELKTDSVEEEVALEIPPPVVLTTEEYEEHSRLLEHYTPDSGVSSFEPSNVFEQPDPDTFDYDKELGRRDTAHPYVLHKDEYAAEEYGFSQTTLTFYTRDRILTDEFDCPINGWEQVVGELMFGHGSGDPDVVYIRNHKFQAEYEVVKQDKAYATEVLGMVAEDEIDGEIRHSFSRRARLE